MNRSIVLAAIASACLVVAAGSAQAQARRIAAAVATALTANPGVPTAGASNGDVTVIEYMDYNCPYCRKLDPELQALMKAEPKVRILYKDWPIFGGVSVYAAKVALAAAWQGKYLQAHEALLHSSGRLDSEADVRSAVKGAGADLGRLDRDLNAHRRDIEGLLERNSHEAEELGLQGTPGLVVGSLLVPGGLPESQLQALVRDERRPGRP